MLWLHCGLGNSSRQERTIVREVSLLAGYETIIVLVGLMVRDDDLEIGFMRVLSESGFFLIQQME